MREDFLHYVWQHQYFDKFDLRTTAGEEIQVLRPGQRNADAGPDFLNARLRLGEVEWNGAVEIHLRASDWQRHNHQVDKKYDQVVLHVVHDADADVHRTNGSLIPVLALGPRLAPDLLGRYQALLQTPPAALPCAPLLPQVPQLTRTMMTERALLERVERKAATLAELHEHLGHDWEATTYHALMAAFGFQKNSEPLARLAKAVPLPVLRRHRHDARQLEALLFGQAGFLVENEETAGDAYLADRRQEHEFLRHKYGLGAAALAAHEWNYLRLRPANFPAVRLGQLVGLLHRRPVLFDALLTATSVAALGEFFAGAPAPDYWRQHYRPGRAGKVPTLGKSSIELLIINVVVPLRVAYARHTGQPDLTERSVALLSELPAEHNQYTDLYESLGFEHRTAADSQGLLALRQGYCEPRRCLHCTIGAKLVGGAAPRLRVVR